MLKQQGSATDRSPATTTPVVTVDRVTDAHRAVVPNLPDGFVVAVYRDGAVTIPDGSLVVHDPMLVAWLHTHARLMAGRGGLVHDEGCGYCGVRNCVNAAEHEWLSRSTESAWRGHAA